LQEKKETLAARKRMFCHFIKKYLLGIRNHFCGSTYIFLLTCALDKELSVKMFNEITFVSFFLFVYESSYLTLIWSFKIGIATIKINCYYLKQQLYDRINGRVWLWLLLVNSKILGFHCKWRTECSLSFAISADFIFFNLSQVTHEIYCFWKMS